MNRFLTFLFILFIGTNVHGQSQAAVTVLIGTNYSTFKQNNFLQFDNQMQDYMPYQMNLGYAIEISGELPIRHNQSLIFGGSATRTNIYPRNDYGLWYGMIFWEGEESIYLHPGYLNRLRHDMLEIPVSWRFYFQNNSRFNPFVGIGMNTSFSWRYTERWKSFSEPEDFMSIPNLAETRFEYEVSKRAFHHDRTAITVNLGSLFQITPQWSMLIDTRVNLAEHRRKLQSAQQVPLIWDTGVTFLNRFSAHVGLRRTL